jgi:hypothetical protein
MGYKPAVLVRNTFAARGSRWGHGWCGFACVGGGMQLLINPREILGVITCAGKVRGLNVRKIRLCDPLHAVRSGMS